MKFLKIILLLLAALPPACQTTEENTTAESECGDRYAAGGPTVRC